MKSNEAKNKGMGLDTLGDLSGLLAPVPVSTGRPLVLPLDLIEEDKDQPRRSDNPGFSDDSIGELAMTIQERGVKSPISVREKPDGSGKYIINHGARRYRASRLAGMDTIVAFIDNDYNRVDQVIENLQRDALTAREIADFIGRELARGMKRTQIAKTLGKSASFVTQYATLLNLPDPVADVFSAGRVSDITLINELVKSYQRDPDEVTAWLSDTSQDVTRGSVKLLNEYIEHKDESVPEPAINIPSVPEAGLGQNDTDNLSSPELLKNGRDENTEEVPYKPGPAKAKQQKKRQQQERDADLTTELTNPVLLVIHNYREARLIMTRRPSEPGLIWIKYEDDGYEIEADMSRIMLTNLVDDTGR